MKVRELLAALSKLDQEMEVLCYTKDEWLVEKGRPFRLLDIVSVDVAEGERWRVDGEPILELGQTHRSSKLALIDVTSSF